MLRRMASQRLSGICVHARNTPLFTSAASSTDKLVGGWFRKGRRSCCAARAMEFPSLVAAAVGAGLMLNQYSRWLRDLPVDADLCVNLLASEMSVA